MSMFSAKGLNNFISDLRSCKTKEAEQHRVDKELVKIRKRFTQRNVLTSYDKKKYAWKLIYIYMLGYDVDFGHMQLISLLSGSKYSEKCLGYLGCSIMLKSTDELMTLVVNSVRNDLRSPEASTQCLALSCVANLAGNEFADALAPEVANLLMSSSSISQVRKKAALCVNRLLPANPDIIPVEDLEDRLGSLITESHLGVVNSAVSLLQTAVQIHPTRFRNLIESCVGTLSTLQANRQCPREYLYFGNACPWLQVKLLRLLQKFGYPEDAYSAHRLEDVLNRMVNCILPGKGAKHNAAYAILIEAVNLIISFGSKVESKLKDSAVELLGHFIALSQPNIRYVGLNSLYHLVRLEGGASKMIKQHKGTVLFSLKDADNSVRRRALDLIFTMCDRNNALEVVGELVNYLTIADGKEIREEIVLKTAILAEKYADNLEWYVDTVSDLITVAGHQVPDSVWHRVVQLVTNKEELQKYAASRVFRALEPKTVDETSAKFGGYVLGEFGYLIAEEPDSGIQRQFEILHRHYTYVSQPTKGLLLTAMIKMANLFEEIRPRVEEVFAKCASSVELEIQQRACEYLALEKYGNQELLQSVLEPMPQFPEDRESLLIARLEHSRRPSVSHSFSTISEKGANQVDKPEFSKDAKVEEDLLSFGYDVPTGPKVVAPSVDQSYPNNSNTVRAASPVATLMDDLNSIDGPPPAPFRSTLKGMENALTSINPEWRRNLMLSPQGKLLETDLLQIGVKHQYLRSQGLLQLFYGNKSETNDLINFTIEIENMRAFRMQSEDIPLKIKARQQIRQQVNVEVMGPFVQPPKIKVSFMTSSTDPFQSNPSAFQHIVELPCHATSFLEPFVFSREDFMKCWKQLANPPDREQQDVIASTREIDMKQTREQLTQTLKFALVEGLDKDDTSLSLAATFCTGATTTDGEKKSVGCLARIETTTTRTSYRITVRSSHPDVSVAIKTCLRSILE